MRIVLLLLAAKEAAHVERGRRSCYHHGMKRSLLLLVLLGRAAHADEAKYACHVVPADSKVTVELKPDVSLADMSIWVASFTCMSVVYDSGVAQHATKVHVIAPKPLTPKQAVQLFVDSVQATGLVIEQKPDTIVVKRNPKMPQGCPDAVASQDPPPATPVPPPAPDPDQEKLDAAIVAGITVIDDTHRVIKRDLVDKVLANPMAVAKGARVVPSVKNGKPDGFKLYAIRPTSIYARLGFQNGDTLQAINGFDLTSADKALEVYAKLREATALQIDITRRGKPISLNYTIK